MDLYTLIKAVILGLVEGLSEFAPISSTGHMIIVDDLWLQSKEFLGKYPANTFKVVIQLGSILAVIVIFRERFMDMLDFKSRRTAVKSSGDKLKLSHIIVGLLPAGVLGVLFEDAIDEYLFSIETVLIGLFVGAVFMIIADVISSKYNSVKVESVDMITHKQALIVGLIQCLALWPGFSRSGSTISGGVLLGMNHRTAADFTFIMAVPIMLGASVLSLAKNWQYFTIDVFPFMAAGFISAFIFALVSIKFFLKLINKVKLIPFAIYRILLVLVIYVLYF
ncbi:undecaprenyl-diphosphate phosphatase [[Bacillus] enclensis]|uniref:undecaprenyl-diphosphate phosphatase n=1 Tax=[Bacillus] enclensis TaxID=1402860 RepID=UPI0018DE77BB|nr:undecaprenyl-diphosphate phosphatase [[Bacillus] enclensis]MBH9967649.1 undecaprenyl-diphosphate phosphatase [[Bacillus] enclensis]QWC23269.1 undecaprenyl-diphosphate phosphatase [Bacillus haikouensis]